MTKSRIDHSLNSVVSNPQKRGCKISRRALPTFVFACCVIFCAVTVTMTATASAQFHDLHSFVGTDGANPYGGLVQGTDGYFYGTTIDGGAKGGGNVFKISPTGTVTSLYTFCSRFECADGQYPVTTLVQGPDGNFYGTTQSGGTRGGWGTVFKITPAGKLTTLHSFDGFTDGAGPYGSLVLATNGRFYGSVTQGGPQGVGSIFEIAQGGRFSTLYSFCVEAGCPDGSNPVGQLIQATDGNIYGTTHTGGSNVCSEGCGTIYKMTLDGALTTLHAFDNTDGEYPYGGVLQAADGTFYGTTPAGGVNGSGTVFNMTATGAVSVIHDFDGTDGSNAYALTLGSDGNFYGTTAYGGRRFAGTIFEITPAGAMTLLHTFNGKDGKNLFCGLVQGTDGKFYGTAYFGGPDADGTVFAVTTGLAPFVETEPTSGKAGSSITILGSNLTDTKGVTFNGVSASFTIVSKTEIQATIPKGATSGQVEVVTSHGDLWSNVAFQVTE
jgi:uncharacterized repeat protein (TIGR03803 family)